MAEQRIFTTHGPCGYESTIGESVHGRSVGAYAVIHDVRPQYGGIQHASRPAGCDGEHEAGVMGSAKSVEDARRDVRPRLDNGVI